MREVAKFKRGRLDVAGVTERFSPAARVAHRAALWGPTRSGLATAALGVGFLQIAVPPATSDIGTDLETVDRILNEVEDLVRNAHFHTAIGVARTARGWDADRPTDPTLRSRRARLHVLAATAHIALNQAASARQSLRRALALNPRLLLDEATTSPKLLAVLNDLRSTRPANGSGS